ncbi:uncharacterized protein EI90DRAFT_3046438 [Cantharellus anzutake]|uniref:uncharacterized protein n=1 Tax=Cantharellus anzutake TaxID=1750568 RepID=UPI001904A30E|nr:uncharacterized protein EI90DRAFT_3046438 [Cantharellus anzutake]KAF8336614.1 hypothetical protein EI90DRAFT_3046438 [Cantharellus anzutake]
MTNDDITLRSHKASLAPQISHGLWTDACVQSLTMETSHTHTHRHAQPPQGYTVIAKTLSVE